MTAPERIAVVRLSSVGDVIFALPALETLRAHRPHAHIAWIVEDRAADLLTDHPALDEIIVMPRRSWREARRRGASRLDIARRMRRFGRELRARRFDTVFDFQGNLKSGLVTRSTGAKMRLGFHRRDCREPNWLFTNRRLPPMERVLHRVERDLLLLTLAGIPWEYRRPRLSLPDTMRSEVRDLTKSLPGEGPLIILNPGTSAWFPSKRWPVASWAALADRLQGGRPLRVGLNLGPDEVEMGRAIQDLAARPLHALPVLPDMRRVACLMDEADLVIGGDTGPVHLASALGRKVLALFGPYDPRLYHPYQHPERALYHALPCSPCRYRSCPGRQCMAAITPEEVFARAVALLNDEDLIAPLPRPRPAIQVSEPRSSLPRLSWAGIG
ncbi:MAG TPA: lipopolysaccharide heptosyltransferase family protein [Planctomycetes bacterium]|nr:lipopolysaccharide heptosyltransferase family protein [Planctomycetota bacterium]